MELLDEIEEAIEMLKVAYERYFNGVDRVPPTRDHDAVKLQVRNLARMQTGSTAVRFRAQGLKARLITYEQYWTRILGQIERGTFTRVVAESKRREYEIRRKRPEEDSAAPAPGGGPPTTPAEPNAPTAASPRPPSRPVALPDGMNASEARELFKEFVAAKKAAGESTSGLTYGRLVEKLAKELPVLQEKHGAGIRFEVTTVNGKVQLRARRRANRPGS